jgi:uracil-DNA glycosylase family 4
VNSIGEMRAELTQRIKNSGLEGQCLCDGAFHSEIAVVAEAPGEREVETGRPLVGGSGSKLWEVLRGFKFSRGDVYITNVSKRQVSLGHDKRYPINRHELESWYSLLQWELEQLPNLRYVLVLGNLALQALLGRTGITDWRGSVIDHQLPNGRKITFVCTFNPAMVLRDPATELSFKLDCSKLRKVVDGAWTVVPVRPIINPSFRDAVDYLTMLERAGEPIAYDIEIISGETACIGFANDPNEGICISFRSIDEASYDLSDEREIRKRVNHLLRNPDVRLITQNGMFDASWLSFKDRIVPRAHYFDTMLAHHTLYPVLPHNLGYITTQYTTRPFYKNEKDDWKEGGNIDAFWKYNVQDCCNTWSAHVSMLGELKQQGLDKFFFEHVMRLQPHLIQMTVGGVLVDVAYKDKIKEELGRDLTGYLQEFYDAVEEATGIQDYYPNPNSPKDMSDLLFNKLRLVGRGSSTNAENRSNMFAHPATTDVKRKVITAVDKYKEEQKFYSTYADAGVDTDNRMRCTYNQTGVQSAPGRLSSSGMLWGTGMNLQNQPDRAHSMFIADPNYGLGYFDMSQAEARVVGWLANIEKWIEQFERARVDGLYDAHRALASEMFGVPYDEVPSFDRYDTAKGHPPVERIGNYTPPTPYVEFSPTIRYIAKRCRHGLNYRMGPERLAAVTQLPLKEAMIAYRTYHRITPELQQWWADVEREVRDNGTMFNVLGRRWLLMQRISPDALESIVAFKPQSTIGDWVSRVIYKAHDDPKWPSDARMALNVHDALICLAPLAKLELCISIALKYAGEKMSIPYKSKGSIMHRGLIIPSDAKISQPNERGFHSWGSLAKAEVEPAR